MGVWADLFLSGWASQTGLTNDPTSLATAGGISDSLMRPQGFCAYRDRGREKRVVTERKREGKMSRREKCAVKSEEKNGCKKRKPSSKEQTKQKSQKGER